MKEATGIALCWILIDSESIVLDHLIIKGVVQFTNDVDFDQFSFSAITIQVLVSVFFFSPRYTSKVGIKLKVTTSLNLISIFRIVKKYITKFKTVTVLLLCSYKQYVLNK